MLSSALKTKDTCCICNPELRINPNLCPKHKAEGRSLATEQGVLFRDAAADLYFAARERMEAA